MAGCRSLTELEKNAVLSKLESPRDRCLFILGYYTGFRISELLSLDLKDAIEAGKVRDRIRVHKRNTKGKVTNREVILHPEAKLAILDLVRRTLAHTIQLEGDVLPLFLSRNGIRKRLSRFGAHKVLKDAFRSAGLTGPLATHTMRKSFAARVYRGLKHDIVALRDALGHADIGTTAKYIEVNRNLIDQAVLSA